MGFCLLINATFIMAFVGFVNQLGLSLTMYSQAYSSTDIAMAVAFAALVSIPLIVLFGWLSDRYPRWRLLVACFVAAGTGTLVLARASVLWQFWLASMLVAVLAASDSLSNALATDLMPMDRVGQGVSITNAVRWMGAVAGLGVAGIAIETWGSQRALLVVLCLVPVATVMATQIRPDLSPTRKVLAS
jgi:MFS family permease